MKDIDGAKVNIFFGTNTTCMMDFTTNTTEKNCLIRKKKLHIDEFVRQSVNSKSAQGMNFEFAANISAMSHHGIDRKTETVAHLLVGKSLDQFNQNFFFARTQLIGRRV